MAKFSGNLVVVTGYVDDTGVYKRQKAIYPVVGNLVQDRTVEVGSGDKNENDSLTFSNRFSFLASPRIVSVLSVESEGVHPIYLECFGVKLRVKTVTIKWPRVEITTGGLWIDEEQD